MWALPGLSTHPLLQEGVMPPCLGPPVEALLASVRLLRRGRKEDAEMRSEGYVMLLLHASTSSVLAPVNAL